MKRILFVPFSIAFLTIQVYSQAVDLQFLVSSGDQVLEQQNGLVKKVNSLALDFSVQSDRPQQTIQGFGGCFNEQGWAALLTLDAADRQAVISAVFDPGQGNLSWGRIPIGASDYALERYTLAPVADDFGMEHFSIERDRLYLIPFIKAAQAVRPDLKFWGSAWSPPIWMKDNAAYEAGRFIDQSAYYQAYALYLARFAEEYAKSGIQVLAVAVQNEPTVVTGYPNGGWKPEQFRQFIRDFAGPLFQKRQLDTKIWLATLNEGDPTSFAKTVLSDPAAARYVAAVGLQWDGDRQIPWLKKHHPQIPIVQTETDCGNWHWRPGFNRDRAPNDFAYAAFTWGRIRDYLVAGAESYMLWNIVLDQHGKNIDRKLQWPQNSAIVVDTERKNVTYTPMFRAFTHFSRLVPVGSQLLACQGPMKDVVAFRNPDGRIVVELMNPASAARKLVGQVAGQRYAIELPPQSFATLILD